MTKKTFPNEKELLALSIEELEASVRYHNHLYWDLDQPEIADVDYDRLVERLKELHPGSPVLQELGPAEVGRTGAVVVHTLPMLSLDKCYSDEDLLSWAAKFEGDSIATPKMDGIAASLRYDKKGRLALAATRGTGLEGDDVTANARTIKDILAQVPRGEIEVRGEIYMRLSVFAEFADQFSNPRNLTAGAIKHKDPARCRDYRLSFSAYDLLGTEHATEKEKLDYLARTGFPLVAYQLVDRARLREAYDHIAKLRDSLDFEIDGVVFKANAVSEQERLGSTAHHPRFALAYKFQGDSDTSTLLRVDWSVARSGVITPIAHIAPVTLSGASVSRASLHNAGFLKKLGLLDRPPGAKVEVTRRGGVIPKVERVVEHAPAEARGNQELITFPTACPSCGGPVTQQKDFLYCVSPETCRDATIATLAHYCTVLDILGFGDKLLAQAYDQEVLKDPVDLYTLTDEKLLKLERVGPKLAAKLVKEVADHRQMELATFLRALGIEELGRHVADILQEQCGTLERVRQVTIEELSTIHTMGPEIASNVVRGLKQKAKLIDQLLEHVTLIQPNESTEKKKGKGPLAGQSFVFTGALLAFDRKTAQKRVQELGGETPNDVTKSLTYLVLGGGVEEATAKGEGASARKSSKQTKAEKYIAEGAPIRIMTEGEFLKIMGDSS